VRLIDPFRMLELFWPGVKFYAKQREILRSVRDNDETFVVAGNMMGYLPPALV
jgi:hypothetical protein